MLPIKKSKIPTILLLILATALTATHTFLIAQDENNTPDVNEIIVDNKTPYHLFINLRYNQSENAPSSGALDIPAHAVKTFDKLSFKFENDFIGYAFGFPGDVKPNDLDEPTQVEVTANTGKAPLWSELKNGQKAETYPENISYEDLGDQDLSAIITFQYNINNENNKKILRITIEEFKISTP